MQDDFIDDKLDFERKNFVRVIFGGISYQANMILDYSEEYGFFFIGKKLKKNHFEIYPLSSLDKIQVPFNMVDEFTDRKVEFWHDLPSGDPELENYIDREWSNKIRGVNEEGYHIIVDEHFEYISIARLVFNGDAFVTSRLSKFELLLNTEHNLALEPSGGCYFIVPNEGESSQDATVTAHYASPQFD